MAKGNRLWTKGADGLRVYAVPALDDGTYKLHASYDLDENKIRVVDTDKNVMGAKLFHELVHKALHGLPGSTAEAMYGGGLPEDEFDKREEALCECLEQRLYPLLVANGWLRFPAPPKKKTHT